MSSYDNEKADTDIFKVVVNHEEQYSIWLADREPPLGWKEVGKAGPKAECLSYIKEVWTDMRPLSLRKQMEETQRNPPVKNVDDGIRQPAEKDDLVQRLSASDHPVEVSLKPEKNCKAFQDRIDLDYVHIKFPNTRGGTELGVRLDRDALNLRQANFENQQGVVHLEGGLTLNYQKVRCIADINLETLTGYGRLKPIEG